MAEGATDKVLSAGRTLRQQISKIISLIARGRGNPPLDEADARNLGRRLRFCKTSMQKDSRQQAGKDKDWTNAFRFHFLATHCLPPRLSSGSIDSIPVLCSSSSKTRR